MSDQDKTREQLIAENDELRRREEQWRSIVVNTPLFVCLVDRAGTIQYLNRTVPGIAMEDAIGRSTYDFIEPAHWGIARECIERVFDTGQPACYELISAGPNGSRSWYETSVGPVKAGDQVVAVTLIATNITERKRAEEALRLSEEHHRVLKETMLQGVVHHDAEGTIIAMNPAAEHILGKSREQFLGSSSTGEEHDTIREDGSLFPGVEHPAMVALRTGQPVTGVVMGVFNPKVDAFRWISIDAVPLFRPGENRPYQVYAVFEDITERKQAEEALREREAQLLEAQEVASLGFYVLDIATGRFTTSSVLDRLFGIPADYERSVEGWANLVHPDERQEMLDYFLKEVVGGKKPFDREYRIVRYRDNQVRWVHGLGRLQFNEDGRPISMLGTVQDITERKHAEEALQMAHDELEQRVEERTAELTKANDELRAIYDGMGDGLLVADIETRQFVRGNASICRMLGYSEDELLSLAVKDIHPEADLPFVVGQFQALADGTLSVSEEIPVLRKDGTVFYAVVSQGRVTRSGRRCVVGFFRDVTERKRSQEALRQSHDELCAIYDGMFDGLLILDLETKRFARANPSICRMLGYSEKELLSISVTDIHPPDEIPVVLRRIQARAEGRFQGHATAKLLRKDGGLLWADISSNRLTYGGRPCMAGFFRDVTERMQAEAALAESEAKHRQLIETTDTGYLILDDEGRVVDANAEYIRISGHHDLNEIVGHSVVEWTAPYDRHRNAQEVSQCVQTGQVRQLDVDYIGLNGTVIRQRARLLGGRLTIESTPGSGTLVQVVVPIVEQQDEE